MIITIASFIIFMVHLVLNLSFLIFYCFKLQFNDVGFNHWRSRNQCSVALILILTGLVSFKTFRLIYARFFGLSKLSAQIDDKEEFSKKI